ncbi:MAG: DUF4402 domain-containing protein [Lutibacter sp.]|uniref:DUF4402 domain-containing protein n=1 Tax=Lutibacter sp. TaxID=1925666 RepID=UPI0017932C64|nr:DUF4402 domain-containing protein [Lutibacter sp.]MBT8317628.1 DUF4402 domain-containing protein [Lutibacter sp.]NNJ58487.1 DUF4402 domain-containing protein [Lutibacter sp.]
MVQLVAVFLFVSVLFAQPALPERGITVLPTQAIDFGIFYVNGAGTIEVDYQGNVTVTGGVISLNTTSVTPAIFEIKLCQGRTITIDYDYSVMINGSNGGQLELVIGPTERGISGDEFPSQNDCNFITVLRVGGKLLVPSNAVPGIYTGSFPMTFTQE